MSKLPLAFRLLLNTLVFSIPVIVLTNLMYKAETVNIDFGKKESLGNQMQRPYEKVLHAVSTLKLIETFQQNPTNINKDRLVTDIENTLNELEILHSKIGDELLFTDEGLSSRKRETASLKNLRSYWSAKKYDDMIGSLKLSITHLGDTSNLILDPDLDSYYLMDVTLLALPQMQDRIHSILSQKTQLFQSKDKDAQKTQAAVLAAMLNESDLNRISADVQTTLNEDPNFYGSLPSVTTQLPSMLEPLKAKTEIFLATLNKIAKGEEVSEDDFFRQGLEAYDQSHASWNTSVDVLDDLLKTRIKTLSAARMKALIISGLALLLAIAFSILVGFSLSNTIKNILKSVLELSNASDQSLKIGRFLKSKSENVSQFVSTQASAIEQIAAAMNELTSILEINSQNTQSASQLSDNINRQANHAEKEVDQLLHSMGAINSSSQKIITAIGVIDDIAFQTNLLALNASVEAARAGELGRGFAVVADAVRSLATKSSEAAKDINKLITESAQSIDSGRKNANQTAEIIRSIIDMIQKLSALNSELANSSSEQVTGIGHVSASMQQIESETQETHVSLVEVVETSDKILQQSTQLKGIVNVLEFEVKGRNATQSNQTAGSNTTENESIKVAAS